MFLKSKGEQTGNKEALFNIVRILLTDVRN